MLSPDARAGKERIFSTAVRPKIGKRRVLDKNLFSGPPSLGGCHLIGRHNNQIVVGGCGRIDVGEKAHGGWSGWGGGVQSFEVTNSNDEKIYI